MLGQLFGDKPKTRADVALALTGAVFALVKAWDTTSKYKAEQKARKDKENPS